MERAPAPVEPVAPVQPVATELPTPAPYGAVERVLPPAPRVALLLPLSGANRRLGEAMLNAAQLAVFDLAGEDFELIVRDTMGSPEGARLAVQTAIAEGARLVVGPLLATSTRAVVPETRPRGISVLTFSSDETVAETGVYVMGFAPQPQIRRLAGYAVSQGLFRFAVLAPLSPYGQTVATAFRDAVAQQGGVMSAVEYYDPGSADLHDVVRRLADYDHRKSGLEAQRAALRQRGDEASQRALRRLKNLDTLGDLPFEGLLLADGGARLREVAPLLPFYDIDPARVRMLGTGQWDDPNVITEPALHGGWFVAPPPDARRDFMLRYRNTFGAPAPRLATLAYDTIALAAVLARNAPEGAFTGETLTQSSGFAGLDGLFRLRPDGTVDRGLAILQVRPDGLVTISPAPPDFETATN